MKKRAVAIEVLRVGLTVAGGCVLAVIVAKHLPDIPIANRLILAPPGDRAEPESDESVPGAGLLGQTGVAISHIGFGGMARIDGRRVDVVTVGEAIPPGIAVRVVEVVYGRQDLRSGPVSQVAR